MFGEDKTAQDGTRPSRMERMSRECDKADRWRGEEKEEGDGAAEDSNSRTWISMTKMMREKWDRGTPRESRVTFPGQSQISSGMTVLVRSKDQELGALTGEYYALVFVL